MRARNNDNFAAIRRQIVGDFRNPLVLFRRDLLRACAAAHADGLRQSARDAVNLRGFDRKPMICLRAGDGRSGFDDIQPVHFGAARFFGDAAAFDELARMSHAARLFQ